MPAVFEPDQTVWQVDIQAVIRFITAALHLLVLREANFHLDKFVVLDSV